MKKTKTIVAFLMAVTVVTGAMGTTAFAADTAESATVTSSATNVKYETDDPAYMARIDALYDYVPLEDLVLKCLNKYVDNEDINKETYENKWYYKHVFTGTDNFEIVRHKSNVEVTVDSITAESLQLAAEQGKADDIETKDGKVRKFNTVDIYWSVLISDTVQDKEEINTFLSDNDLRSHVEQTTGDGRQFALHFDEVFTTEEVINTLTALNEKFGILPGTVAHEQGSYTLYYDSAYSGSMTDKTWTAPITEPDPYIGEDWVKHNIYTENEGVLEGGATYHYNPETGGMLIDGDGILTYADGSDVIYNFHPKFYVLGKAVKLDNTVNGEEDDFNSWLHGRLFKRSCDVYAFRDSDTEDKYNEIIDAHLSAYTKGSTVTKEGLESYYAINYLDDTVDPYDVLNGTADITPASKDKYLKSVRSAASVQENENTTSSYENVSKAVIKAEDLTEAATKATLSGDADLNGEVGLSDIIAVSKYTVNSTTYPLANETAVANADINGDKVIDTLDTSALIEINLGR